LVGDSLVRSLGSWSEVLSMHRDGKRLLTDQWTIGSGDFVERILAEADQDSPWQKWPDSSKFLRLPFPRHF